jgi:hypothetical protein
MPGQVLAWPDGGAGDVVMTELRRGG